MKKLVQLLFILLPLHSFSQHTFSICAYDSITGQVGSAGATCIQASTSAVIISDVIAGVGVVHTQAQWLQANKTYAHNLMLLGLTPQQVIDSVTLHDAQGNPTIRQYGVVDVTGASAGYTGTACLNYHNHKNGPGYAIQGNILLGPQILDSMESRFLNTPGDLACRLMAALQGAKVVGADTRCTNLGISSVSAFIRVANPSDTGTNPLYLNISINTYPNYQEPIDSLQERFDLWGGCNAAYIPSSTEKAGMRIFPIPAEKKLTINSGLLSINTIDLYNFFGMQIRNWQFISGKNEVEVDLQDIPPGIYFLVMKTDSGTISSCKFVKQ